MGAGVFVAAVAAWFIALSVYDLRSRRLPNVLTIPGALLVLGTATACGRGWPALAGALSLAGIYLLVHLAAPTGMGAGDVKLALGIGALTGAVGVDTWVAAALGAPFLTGLWGVVAAIRGSREPIPHGPSMCVAAAAAVAAALV